MWRCLVSHIVYSDCDADEEEVRNEVVLREQRGKCEKSGVLQVEKPVQ